MIEVTLRLHDENSLEQLIKGCPVYAVWLLEREPGVYTLNSLTGGSKEDQEVYRKWIRHTWGKDFPLDGSVLNVPIVDHD